MSRSILFYILFFTLLLALPKNSFSHPGIGIVKDSKGNIYYTDLKQIWKIKPDGNRTIVVKSVHSHEISIDAMDNIYGEHLWYNGDSVNTWGHYAWRLNSNGTLDTVLGPKAGFLENYSFNRDAAGNMYWIQQWKPNRFKKLTPDGNTIVLAEREMDEIGWMHVTTDGKIYFTDRHDLYELNQSGKIRLLAKNPGAVNKSKPDINLWGIWTDAHENIYVANMEGRKVIKIDSSGKTTPLVVSTGGWFPLSGVFDNGGNLWLMEANITNEVRVTKITAGSLAHAPVTVKTS